MKKVIFIMLFIFTTNHYCISQSTINLKLQGGKTYIKIGKYYEPTNKYYIVIDKRKMFVFNFVNKNYKVTAVGRRTKELKVYSNRTILKVKGIILLVPSVTLILEEYKN